jgi:DNA-binding beta-propeller fold protein YncE
VYVGDSNATSVSIIDTAAGNTRTSVSVGTQAPQVEAYDSSTGLVCVTTSGGASVAGNAVFINSSTGSVAASLAVGRAPKTVAVNSVRGECYVANQSSDTVTIISE